MFAFVLGDYRVPLLLIELNSFSYCHTHRTCQNTFWKEELHMTVAIPGVWKASVRVANDNKEVALT